jgi:hypothetical protein
MNSQASKLFRAYQAQSGYIVAQLLYVTKVVAWGTSASRSGPAVDSTQLGGHGANRSEHFMALVRQ